ncbi:hypothetical protein ABIB17_002445 [Arthrobacter sp. UYEF6]
MNNFPCFIVALHDDLRAGPRRLANRIHAEVHGKCVVLEHFVIPGKDKLHITLADNPVPVAGSNITDAIAGADTAIRRANAADAPATLSEVVLM